MLTFKPIRFTVFGLIATFAATLLVTISPVASELQAAALI